MNHQRGQNSLPKQQESNKVYLLICGLVSTIVFFAACTFTLVITETQSIFATQSSYFSEGWTDDRGNKVTLPLKLAYPQSGSYTLQAIVPEQGLKEQDISLLFSAKYLNVTLFLDDKEIGSCLGKPEGTQKLVGKTYLIATLPNDAVGKELRIEATPLLSASMSYEINAPLLGTGESLVYDLISHELLMLTILEAIFCFGLLLMLFSWQARKTGNKTFFQTGLFAIVFAMYSLAITDTIHLFLSNSQLIYLMEFLLLALTPLPLLVLVYHVSIPKFRKILLLDIGLLTLNFCLQVALYFFTDLELRDTVLITHIVLGLSVILLIPILALSGRQGDERFRLLVSFSPVLVGATCDITQFYLPGIYQKAVGFQLGVLLFIFLQTIYLVRSYLESDLYRTIAYTDALTGLKNRTAFEEKIIQLSKTNAHDTSLWCVCADVNGLKWVNDTLGHSMGDALIRSAAKALEELKGKEGNLYRTGGDEFVLFLFNQSNESMERAHTRFEATLDRYNQNHDVPLSIALGYDHLKQNDTINKLISRADSIMYEDKHRKKEIQINQKL